MKKIIAVIGDVCSGKTTTAKLIAEKLHDYKVFSIDDFRKRYNPDASVVGEDYAVGKLREAVLSPTNEHVILECSGVGKYYPTIIWEAQVAQALVYIVKLTCPDLETIFERKHKREQKPDYSPTPFAYSHRYNFDDSIRWIHKKVKAMNAHVTYDTSQLTQQEIATRIANYIQSPTIPLSTALARMDILARKKQKFQLTYITAAGQKKKVLAEVRGRHLRRKRDNTIQILEWCNESEKMVYSSPKASFLAELDGAKIDHERVEVRL